MAGRTRARLVRSRRMGERRRGYCSASRSRTGVWHCGGSRVSRLRWGWMGARTMKGSSRSRGSWGTCVARTGSRRFGWGARMAGMVCAGGTGATDVWGVEGGGRWSVVYNGLWPWRGFMKGGLLLRGGRTMGERIKGLCGQQPSTRPRIRVVLMSAPISSRSGGQNAPARPDAPAAARRLLCRHHRTRLPPVLLCFPPSSPPGNPLPQRKTCSRPRLAPALLSIPLPTRVTAPLSPRHPPCIHTGARRSTRSILGRRRATMPAQTGPGRHQSCESCPVQMAARDGALAVTSVRGVTRRGWASCT
ncbi:hypothetical protein FA95DRAFT_1014123 [Auriscalpium vulgare]|uniref:Uncharacterized protein n=1 Tax=Auriscalpium vulgare TaxID=40419 RepID=A0ACB8R7I3_9AGAM|nr:hypothetical protein FA95DRAFT_1014123 [Auriscalpium vulgare]